MAWISREFTRQQLAQAQAHRFGTLNKSDWESYQSDVQMMTTVPRSSAPTAPRLEAHG